MIDRENDAKSAKERYLLMTKTKTTTTKDENDDDEDEDYREPVLSSADGRLPASQKNGRRKLKDMTSSIMNGISARLLVGRTAKMKTGS